MDIIKPRRPWAHWYQQLIGLLPCTCCICRKSSDDLLCESCRQELEYDENHCQQCGEQLPETRRSSNTASRIRCGSCIAHPPPYQRTLFAYRYSGPMVQLIHQYKFSEALILSQLLADMVVERIRSEYSSQAYPDALIPVPLHPKRLRERGFNQSLQLSWLIGKALGVPVYRNIVERKRATPKQSGLSKKARERNMKGAFTINSNFKKGKLAGKHLALVDDVITTGSTAREAAKVLNRVRPSTISIVALAKTPRL